MKKTVKKKRYKIKYQNIIICFLIVYLLYIMINGFINLGITNIYVVNNLFLNDQEIIEFAQIENYPSSFKNSSEKIQKRLEENIYLKSVKVYKKNLTEVYIEVEENTPLFYRDSVNKTILSDGTEVSGFIDSPTLINYVPDTIYDKFVTKMNNVDINILKRISEIEYNPNNVDDERFILTMTDGNYVYLTLYKFDNINSYVDIIKNFEDKKGILYLDSGEYFKVLE